MYTLVILVSSKLGKDIYKDELNALKAKQMLRIVFITASLLFSAAMLNFIFIK
jgi:hypothetical protein